MGLATDVQTQDDQLLVKENLVDDKKVEEVDDEGEDEEADDEEEEEDEDDGLDFLQSFPNFYSMAADIMNQLDGKIPEVIFEMLWHSSSVFYMHNSNQSRGPKRIWEEGIILLKKIVQRSVLGAPYKEQFSYCSGYNNRGHPIKLYDYKQRKGNFCCRSFKQQLFISLN